MIIIIGNLLFNLQFRILCIPEGRVEIGLIKNYNAKVYKNNWYRLALWNGLIK